MARQRIGLASAAVRFFNIDLHVSVIADIQRIFSDLGHSVDDWCLSGHHWVLGKERADVPLLRDWHSLTPELCDAFYDAYKDELAGYDGFIACYPAAFAMLYERWEKPTIVVNCVRYEVPYTSRPSEWKHFDEFIQRRIAEKKLWWICNNKGDAWYVNYFTGITPRWIPNLCEYVGQAWTGQKREYLLYGRGAAHLLGVPQRFYVHSDSRAVKGSEWRYTWDDLYSHRGIVHFPYHNGSMSLFEHYTANAPLFLPSKDFLRQLYREGPIEVLAELTFYKVFDLPEPSEPGNPNNLSDPDVLERWLDSFCWYDDENMRHVVLFDSFRELTRLFKKSDVEAISASMAEWNLVRKAMVYDRWTEVLAEIEPALA